MPNHIRTIIKPSKNFFDELVNKIISVDWRDSNMYIEQCNKDDDFQILEITSIGRLIYTDSTKIVIAGDVIGDDVRRVIVIPKENIIGLSDE